MQHLPVMREEVLSVFAPLQISTFIDGTLGAGGHAKALLTNHPEIERYIGFDQDASALSIAQKELEAFGNRVLFINDNFSKLGSHLESMGIHHVDGFFLILEFHQCS